MPLADTTLLVGQPAELVEEEEEEEEEDEPLVAHTRGAAEVPAVSCDPAVPFPAKSLRPVPPKFLILFCDVSEI